MRELYVLYQHVIIYTQKIKLKRYDMLISNITRELFYRTGDEKNSFSL